MQKAIAILYQGRKQDTSELARQLAPQLQAQGHDVRVVDMRDEDEEQADFRLDDCDFALVLGGDGTILHATRLCAPAGIPLLGVNFGRVGFLTELEPDEVTEHLPLYIERDQSVWLDERAMLSAGCAFLASNSSPANSRRSPSASTLPGPSARKVRR